LLVVGCWLLVVGCWLLVVGCWLLVVGCWLSSGELMVVLCSIALLSTFSALLSNLLANVAEMIRANVLRPANWPSILGIFSKIHHGNAVM
jgi:hypothetical protein